MNPNNRWIKKAELVPWNEIEKEYADLFKGKKGQVAKPLRIALGALLIQIEYGYSDEETAFQIQENPYLQFFCGMGGYEDKASFDPSLMVHFRKRLTMEILSKINEMVIAKSQEKSVTKKDDDHRNDPPKNSGTMIVDATCAPSNIKYPQDTELLNEAREKLEKMIEILHDPADGKKPRTYPKKPKKITWLLLARRKEVQKKFVRPFVNNYNTSSAISATSIVCFNKGKCCRGNLSYSCKRFVSYMTNSFTCMNTEFTKSQTEL